MISSFKERPSGGFYCSECRMSFGELHATCPYCGSYVTNYEDLLIKEENDRVRPMFDLDPVTGENKNSEDKLIRGWRAKISPIDDSSFISKEQIEQLLKEIKK